jgi:S1-C subfamily serine protease
MTSGGSSGSPVVDMEGRAVALNAGGATKAASSFFLPLDRVVRVLRLIQKGEPIPRGTIQTVFQYTPYDELRRLGLPEPIETELRSTFLENTGMLTVEHVLPSGPATGKLLPGDILLKINNAWIPDFVSLEDLWDTSVENTILVLLHRYHLFI